MIIGVLGEDAIAAELEKLAKDETVRGRRLVARRVSRRKEVDGCHILYVSEAESAHSEELLAAVRNRPVLTVGETDGFMKAGGIIQFITERRIRLRISLRKARDADLTISSRLLRIAEVENK
jgi:hypothetical protein